MSEIDTNKIKCDIENIHSFSQYAMVRVLTRCLEHWVALHRVNHHTALGHLLGVEP